MIHLLYAAVTRWRRRRAAPRRLSRPVISIGNIAAGGRAKSPMAELVARALMAAGERPSILSRGYARKLHVDAPVVVRDAERVRAAFEQAGDEPLMLAQHLPGAVVVVAPDRARAGAVAESLGATVHVLDDGFQHLRVARDADIVMIEPGDLEDAVFPSGRLREPIDALASASAIVVVSPDAEARAQAMKAVAELPGVRVFGASRRVLPPPVKIAHAPCFLVSGIAGPDQLARSVREAGWVIAGEARYKDHHLYSGQDALAIAAQADAAGAPHVVTTAKDLVRLRGVWNSALGLLAAEMTLDLDDEAGFRAWLLEAVRAARAGQLARDARIAGARGAS